MSPFESAAGVEYCVATSYFSDTLPRLARVAIGLKPESSRAGRPNLNAVVARSLAGMSVVRARSAGALENESRSGFCGIEASRGSVQRLEERRADAI